MTIKTTNAQRIDQDGPAIEICEPRLALSASLAGELLLESLGIHPIPIEPIPVEPIPVEPIPIEPIQVEPLSNTTPTLSPLGNLDTPIPSSIETPDLFSQAAALRETSGFTGQGQTVAVIDSGVAWDHVALGGGYGPGYRVVGGWDFAENDSNPYDDGPAGFHGTHVAGTLAGKTDSFAGIATEAEIVALRVFDDSGRGQLQWIESALQWVHQNRNSFESPITTVNLSVGAALNPENYASATAMLEDELRQLRDDGILVFAASGNLQQGGSFTGDPVLYPASSDSVVAIASVNEHGNLSAFAQREAGILAAPGELVSSSVPDHVYGWDGRVDDFASLSGTSMASPQIAGASMLVRQAMLEHGLFPTADEILARLRDTSIERVDPISNATYRVLDLESATTFDSNIPGIVPEEVPPPASDEPTDYFNGSNGSESITLDFTNGVVLRVGSDSYRLDLATGQTPFVIDAFGGSDSLAIIGSSDIERLVLHPTDSGEPSQLTTPAGQFELRGFEQVDFRGGGGSDRAVLYDSRGNDTLTSGPSQATLSGVGFRFDVLDVPRIFVHATAGGDDAAFLHDSAGDDTLSVRPQFTSLKGDNTFQLAYGFERVYAYAEAGGHDTAELFDSAGDDTMSISSGRALISSEGYQVSTRGFDSVVGIASDSGNDIARIYADAVGNQWHSTEDLVQWTGQSGNVRIARGFERTEAFEAYQPINLSQLSLPSWLRRTDRDIAIDAQNEATATRLIFEQFGESN